MIVVYGAKGGSGVTVVAAALGLFLARQGGCRLIDLAGDLPGALGMTDEPRAGVTDWVAAGSAADADALHHLAIEVAPGLVVIPAGAAAFLTPGPEFADAGERLAEAVRSRPGAVVVDAGLATGVVPEALIGYADAVVMVARPCYLTLRRALAHPALPQTSAVVVVKEPARALGEADVARVLDLPVLATVRAEARIARAVDAGVLAARLPEPLAAMAGRVALETGGRDAPPSIANPGGDAAA